MGGLLVIIVIGLIGLILIGSIMGLTAHSRIAKLEREIRLLRLSISGDSHPIPQTSRTPEPQKANEPAEPVKPKPNPALQLAETHRAKLAAHAETKPPPTKPKRSLEELVGAQWSVWVGGIALLVGTLFLLRFAIESGFFSPLMRVMMAAALGGVLLALGEFLRRKDNADKLPAALKDIDAKANIPGVLTGAGIFALLGAVYSAYALHGFIGPSVAFVLMGLVSLAGMFLGAIHGPKLAALGLVASLATPLFIHTTEPNYPALYGYLGLVAAASTWLSLRRDWVWLKLLTLAGLLGWMFLSIGAMDTRYGLGLWSLFSLASFGLSLWLAEETEKTSPAGAWRSEHLFDKYDRWIHLKWSAIAGLILLFGIAAGDFNTQSNWVGYGFAALFLLTATFRPAQKWMVIIGGAIWTLLSVGLVNHIPITRPSAELAAFASVIFMIGTLILCTREGLKAKALGEKIIWALFGAALPLALYALWPELPEAPVWLTEYFLFALTGLSIAAAFEYRWSRGERQDWPLSALATGVGLSFFGFAISKFDHEGRIIAFLISMIGCAAINKIRPTTAWRIGAPIFAALIAYHILVHIRISDHVGLRLFLNELWFLTALPALTSASAWWLLSRQKDDLWSEGMKAFALAFFALFVVFQIHHAMNGGELGARRFSLEELALQVLAGLSFTLGGSVLRLDQTKGIKTDHERILPYLLSGISLLTMGAFAFGLGLVENPLFERANAVKGGMALNSLTLAYLIPAIMFGLIAHWSRDRRPTWFVVLAGGLGLLGWMIFVTGMVRFGFQGPKIALANWPEDAEMYTISALWLLTGIALLTAGIRLNRVDLRAASAVIIVLTVLKTFLVDMASLEGVLRAISFVILGIVLIAIGRVYQRILFSKSSKAEV